MGLFGQKHTVSTSLIAMAESVPDDMGSGVSSLNTLSEV